MLTNLFLTLCQGNKYFNQIPPNFIFFSKLLRFALRIEARRVIIGPLTPNLLVLTAEFMIFIFGTLAILQMTFLPGFLLLRLFRFKKEFHPDTGAFSLALSMAANYAGIGLLVSLTGLYIRPIVLTIFVLEIACLSGSIKIHFSISMSELGICQKSTA